MTTFSHEGVRIVECQILTQGNGSSQNFAPKNIGVIHISHPKICDYNICGEVGQHSNSSHKTALRTKNKVDNPLMYHTNPAQRNDKAENFLPKN